MSVFVIEDEIHAEWCGEFSSFDAALDELKSRAKLPWDTAPNLCPCMSWKTCCRRYIIIEYDNSNGKTWEQIYLTPIFEISSKGIIWKTRILPPQ